MEDPSINSTCLTCHQPVAAEWFFCPNCGKNLKQKPLSTTWLMQTGLYLLAIFLTPLGLWPGIKYLRSHDPRAKRVGLIVVVLTSLSFIISIWFFSSLFSNALQQANSILGGSGNFQY